MKLPIAMTRTLSIILLIFNGISACFGGGMLLYDPSGATLQMPLEMLQYSPFKDFLWPGLILFTVLGLGSLVVAFVVIRRLKNYPYAIMVIGAALVIWILTQIAMIQGVHGFHALYGGIGLALVALGYMENKKMRL